MDIDDINLFVFLFWLFIKMTGFTLRKIGLSVSASENKKKDRMPCGYDIPSLIFSMASFADDFL